MPDVSVRSPWRVLDIAPTDDARAIRQAYARQLRAMDVDADPAGFAELRHARDWALRGTAATEPAKPVALAPQMGDADLLAKDPPAGTSVIDRATGADPLPPVEHAPPLPGPADPPSGDPALHAIAAHQQRLLGLLTLGDGRTRLPPEAEAELLLHFEALLADPRLQQVAVLADAERWFSELFAAAIPRSDVLLPRAVAHFGWADAASEYGRSPAITRVAQRARSLAFLAEVEAPGHRWHRAWTELTRPATERSWRDLRVRRSTVLQLLATVRRYYPELESHLDWFRVGIWERPLRLQTAITMLLGCGYALFALAGLLTNISNWAPPIFVRPIPHVAFGGPQGLTNPESDIDEALADATGGQLRIAAVKARNRAFEKLMHKRWADARARGEGLADFVNSTPTFLAERFGADVQRADYRTAAAARSLLLARLRAARAVSPEACLSLLVETPGGPASLGPDLAKRQQQVMIDTILKADDGKPIRQRSHVFRMSGTVVTAAAAQAGMTREGFVRALGHGTAAARCTAWIALLDTALALSPAQGLALLRTM